MEHNFYITWPYYLMIMQTVNDALWTYHPPFKFHYHNNDTLNNVLSFVSQCIVSWDEYRSTLSAYFLSSDEDCVDRWNLMIYISSDYIMRTTLWDKRQYTGSEICDLHHDAINFLKAVEKEIPKLSRLSRISLMSQPEFTYCNHESLCFTFTFIIHYIIIVPTTIILLITTT